MNNLKILGRSVEEWSNHGFTVVERCPTTHLLSFMNDNFESRTFLHISALCGNAECIECREWLRESNQFYPGTVFRLLCQQEVGHATL